VTVEQELFTIRDLLRLAVTRMEQAGVSYGHGTDTAFAEAVFLLAEQLRLPRDGIELFLDARLTLAERQQVVGLMERRIATRKPAAYLVNRAYIGDFGFYVDERVIVPRSFIGELLCGGRFGEAGLIADDDAITRILDLCTGSGCLAILAAMAFPKSRIDAADISAEALAVARRNVEDYGLSDRIELHEGDLFAPLSDEPYDLIVTNPPYVAAGTMASLPPEYRHEPALALAGGDDGLSVVRRILAAAPHHLTAAGGLLCEIGAGRDLLEQEFPQLPFFWLDTETSEGEVFWLPGTVFRACKERRA
jgi:ribosomal protein L3 glutamine methyltransferase